MITQFNETKTDVEGEVTSTNQPGWSWGTELFNTAEFETWVASLDTSSNTYTIKVSIEVFINRS